MALNGLFYADVPLRNYSPHLIVRCCALADLCPASSDKSTRRGSHGTEHGAYSRRPARASEAATAAQPLANDQSRHGADPQPGSVPGQSCSTARARRHSSHCTAANESSSGHTTEGSSLHVSLYLLSPTIYVYIYVGKRKASNL